MFRQRLDELVNLQHPLARLARHIDWYAFGVKVSIATAHRKGWWWARAIP